MQLSSYFEPIDIEHLPFALHPAMKTVGDCMTTYTINSEFPNYQDFRLAIVGVRDSRLNIPSMGVDDVPNRVRSALYSLAKPSDDFECVDLGDLVSGQTPLNTIENLTDVLAQLADLSIAVVVIGGSQALTMACYKAYAELGRIINLTIIDSRFDINGDANLNSWSWLYNMVLDKPNFLRNVSYLGIQSYFTGKDQLEFVDKLDFDVIRLGALRNSEENAEPYIRFSDVVSVDVSAIRQSDAPGNFVPSPHGLYGEQLCLLMRYAGLCSKVMIVGMHDLCLELDNHDQTVTLWAQAIWHFFEAFSSRVDDYPYHDADNFRRFIVPMHNGSHNIVFYKSKKTNRWWFELEVDSDLGPGETVKKRLIPCTYADYQCAIDNEIPERWLKFNNRLNR